MQKQYVLSEKETDQLKTILQSCWVGLNQLAYSYEKNEELVKEKCKVLMDEITRARRIIKDMV